MAKLVSEMGDAALYQQAEVLAQWGRTDEAIAKLEQGAADRRLGPDLSRHRPVARPGPEESEIP
jgi:hypothetical protein